MDLKLDAIVEGKQAAARGKRRPFLRRRIAETVVAVKCVVQAPPRLQVRGAPQYELPLYIVLRCI